MGTVKISGCIITFNEEKNIKRCIESMLDVCDEIIVVDSESSDQTVSICKSLGATVIDQPFLGHVEQKNCAVQHANHDWILSLDADEVVSEELRASISSLRDTLSEGAYTMDRLTYYSGKWIYHSGWYPDTKLRLWNKKDGAWGGENPHDKVIIDQKTPVIKLKGHLLHYSYDSIRHHVQQINKYTDISSDELVRKHYKVNVIIDIVLNPIYAFVKYYLIKRGFLDGYHGFVISFLTGLGKFLKYVKVKEKQSPDK